MFYSFMGVVLSDTGVDTSVRGAFLTILFINMFDALMDMIMSSHVENMTLRG